MYSRRRITTEEVQRYLDENERLFTEIMEMIKLGKLAECAEHQERLQQNLMFLAAIADRQQPLMPPERTLPPALQETVAKAQEQGIFSLNMPFQFGNPLHQQHQQAQEHGIFPPKLSLQFDNPQDQLNQQAKEQGISHPMPLQFGNPLHQLPQQAQKHGIFLQNNCTYPMHSKSAFGAGSRGSQPSSSSSTSGQNDAFGRSVEGASEGGVGQGK